jgi:hypothetical protein
MCRMVLVSFTQPPPLIFRQEARVTDLIRSNADFLTGPQDLDLNCRSQGLVWQ